MKLLKSAYCDVYFDAAPFNMAAIDPDTYLIVGRRGAGKTALTQYFSFQKTIPDPIYIDVDEPAVYQRVLCDIAVRASEARELAIPRLMKVWEYIIWCVIFEHARSHSAVIAEACDMTCEDNRVSQVIGNLLERLMCIFREDDEKQKDRRIANLLQGPPVEAAKAETLKLARHRPIIIAIDTLERYDVTNEGLMNAMAALVQVAAEFNRDWSSHGLHLKVFMSGEVFPHLKEEVLQNPSKSVKHPVYLLWRPKDLLRLICWRFYRCLEEHSLLKPQSAGSIDWEDHNQVMERMWAPYFGRSVTNGLGKNEQAFAYVLRHTQMRPRQLILLCNAVAERAIAARRFPTCAEEDIRAGIRDAETDLASEVINSFSSVYPKVSTIIDALMRVPMKFSGNELDKRASQSASEWPNGSYSPARFRRLIAEIGVVGRVRRQNETSGYIDADFEYSLRERLPLTHRDECVVHPMFYSRLNVELNVQARVMPFSTARPADPN
jgi:hypothetical protein